MLSRKTVGYGCVVFLVGYIGVYSLMHAETTQAQSFPQQAGFPSLLVPQVVFSPIAIWRYEEPPSTATGGSE